MKGALLTGLYQPGGRIPASRCGPHAKCCQQQDLRACIRLNVSARHLPCRCFIQHLSPVSVDNIPPVMLFRISNRRPASACTRIQAVLPVHILLPGVRSEPICFSALPECCPVIQRSIGNDFSPVECNAPSALRENATL